MMLDLLKIKNLINLPIIAPDKIKDEDKRAEIIKAKTKAAIKTLIGGKEDSEALETYLLENGHIDKCKELFPEKYKDQDLSKYESEEHKQKAQKYFNQINNGFHFFNPEDKSTENIYLDLYDILKYQQIFYPNLTDDFLAKAAYNILVFFDHNDKNFYKNVSKFINANIESPSPFHEIAIIDLPQFRASTEEKPNFILKEWRDLILKTNDNSGHDLLKLFDNAIEIHYKLNVTNKPFPKTYKALKLTTQTLTYLNSEQNPEMAKIFAHYKISNKRFEKALKFIENTPPKESKPLPEIIVKADERGAKYGESLKGAGTYIVKLPDSDYRALILGSITGCCQSFDGNSYRCVIDGITRENNGFYIIIKAKDSFDPSKIDWFNLEDNGHKIIGQSYAWISKDGNLTLDSLEVANKYAKTINYKEILQTFGEAIVEKSGTIKAVTLGTGGGTFDISEHNDFIKYSRPIPKPERMKEGYMYGDAKYQISLISPLLYYLNKGNFTQEERDKIPEKIKELFSLSRLPEYIEAHEIEDIRSILKIDFQKLKEISNIIWINASKKICKFYNPEAIDKLDYSSLRELLVSRDTSSYIEMGLSPEEFEGLNTNQLSFVLTIYYLDYYTRFKSFEKAKELSDEEISNLRFLTTKGFNLKYLFSLEQESIRLLSNAKIFALLRKGFLKQKDLLGDKAISNLKKIISIEDSKINKITKSQNIEIYVKNGIDVKEILEFNDEQIKILNTHNFFNFFTKYRSIEAVKANRENAAKYLKLFENGFNFEDIINLSTSSLDILLNCHDRIKTLIQTGAISHSDINSDEKIEKPSLKSIKDFSKDAFEIIKNYKILSPILKYKLNLDELKSCSIKQLKFILSNSTKLLDEENYNLSDLKEIPEEYLSKYNKLLSVGFNLKDLLNLKDENLNKISHPKVIKIFNKEILQSSRFSRDKAIEDFDFEKIDELSNESLKIMLNSKSPQRIFQKGAKLSSLIELTSSQAFYTFNHPIIFEDAENAYNALKIIKRIDEKLIKNYDKLLEVGFSLKDIIRIDEKNIKALSHKSCYILLKSGLLRPHNISSDENIENSNIYKLTKLDPTIASKLANSDLTRLYLEKGFALEDFIGINEYVIDFILSKRFFEQNQSIEFAKSLDAGMILKYQKLIDVGFILEDLVKLDRASLDILLNTKIINLIKKGILKTERISTAEGIKESNLKNLTKIDLSKYDKIINAKNLKKYTENAIDLNQIISLTVHKIDLLLSDSGYSYFSQVKDISFVTETSDERAILYKRLLIVGFKLEKLVNIKTINLQLLAHTNIYKLFKESIILSSNFSDNESIESSNWSSIKHMKKAAFDKLLESEYTKLYLSKGVNLLSLTKFDNECLDTVLTSNFYNKINAAPYIDQLSKRSIEELKKISYLSGIGFSLKMLLPLETSSIKKLCHKDIMEFIFKTKISPRYFIEDNGVKRSAYDSLMKMTREKKSLLFSSYAAKLIRIGIEISEIDKLSFTQLKIVMSDEFTKLINNKEQFSKLHPIPSKILEKFAALSKFGFTFNDLTKMSSKTLDSISQESVIKLLKSDIFKASDFLLNLTDNEIEIVTNHSEIIEYNNGTQDPLDVVLRLHKMDSSYKIHILTPSCNEAYREGNLHPADFKNCNEDELLFLTKLQSCFYGSDIPKSLYLEGEGNKIKPIHLVQIPFQVRDWITNEHQNIMVAYVLAGAPLDIFDKFEDEQLKFILTPEFKELISPNLKYITAFRNKSMEELELICKIGQVLDEDSDLIQVSQFSYKALSLLSAEKVIESISKGNIKVSDFWAHSDDDVERLTSLKNLEKYGMEVPGCFRSLFNPDAEKEEKADTKTLMKVIGRAPSFKEGIYPKQIKKFAILARDEMEKLESLPQNIKEVGIKLLSQWFNQISNELEEAINDMNYDYPSDKEFSLVKKYLDRAVVRLTKALKSPEKPTTKLPTKLRPQHIESLSDSGLEKLTEPNVISFLQASKVSKLEELDKFSFDKFNKLTSKKWENVNKVGYRTLTISDYENFTDEQLDIILDSSVVNIGLPKFIEIEDIQSLPPLYLKSLLNDKRILENMLPYINIESFREFDLEIIDLMSKSIIIESAQETPNKEIFDPRNYIDMPKENLQILLSEENLELFRDSKNPINITSFNGLNASEIEILLFPKMIEFYKEFPQIQPSDFEGCSEEIIDYIISNPDIKRFYQKNSDTELKPKDFAFADSSDQCNLYAEKGIITLCNSFGLKPMDFEPLRNGRDFKHFSYITQRKMLDLFRTTDIKPYHFAEFDHKELKLITSNTLLYMYMKDEIHPCSFEGLGFKNIKQLLSKNSMDDFDIAKVNNPDLTFSNYIWRQELDLAGDVEMVVDGNYI